MQFILISYRYLLHNFWLAASWSCLKEHRKAGGSGEQTWHTGHDKLGLFPKTPSPLKKRKKETRPSSFIQNEVTENLCLCRTTKFFSKNLMACWHNLYRNRKACYKFCQRVISLCVQAYVVVTEAAERT